MSAIPTLPEAHLIHEASHAVNEIAYADKIGLAHSIRDIIIDENTCMVRINYRCELYEIRRIMTGDFPEATRQVYAAYAEHVIDNYMAGFAANVILMKYDENYAAELLKQHYRRNESADTDFQKAIRYNIALGRQKETDGILPLVDTLKEAIVEARGNWSAILWAADQLEGGGIIEGEHLEKIIDGIRYELNRIKQ